MTTERRLQARLRSLLKELDERMLRMESIMSLLIEKNLLDRKELEDLGLLQPPLSGFGGSR